MKVALVCPTVGQTQRGYERFCTDLFQLLGTHHEITLFKGAGEPAQREKVVPHLTRTGVLNRICGNRFRYLRYRLEFVSFAAGLFPHLARGRFDLVHFIDPPLGTLLSLCRRLARTDFALLFTKGVPLLYDCSRWADHVHCPSPSVLEETQQSFPNSGSRLTVVPVGVDTKRLHTALSRAELRARLGVPADTFVILSVTTLNRLHKRIDYLIEEVARLEGNFLLWIDGSLYPDGDVSLMKLAEDRLGGRCRITHVSTERVAELYNMADVMVSTAVSETFGMAVVEALCCGLPVITHDSPHFRWLVGDAERMVDMRVPGNLTARLAQMLSVPVAMRPQIDSASVIRRFGWPYLKGEYLELYKATVQSKRAQ